MGRRTFPGGSGCGTPALRPPRGGPPLRRERHAPYPQHTTSVSRPLEGGSLQADLVPRATEGNRARWCPRQGVAPRGVPVPHGGNSLPRTCKTLRRAGGRAGPTPLPQSAPPVWTRRAAATSVVVCGAQWRAVPPGGPSPAPHWYLGMNLQWGRVGWVAGAAGGAAKRPSATHVPSVAPGRPRQSTPRLFHRKQQSMGWFDGRSTRAAGATPSAPLSTGARSPTTTQFCGGSCHLACRPPPCPPGPSSCRRRLQVRICDVFVDQ